MFLETFLSVVGKDYFPFFMLPFLYYNILNIQKPYIITFRQSPPFFFFSLLDGKRFEGKVVPVTLA